jgi:hypothetical protein
MSTPGIAAVDDRLVGLDHDAGGVDLLDDAVAARHEGDAGVAGDDALHAGADEGRVGAEQRHRPDAACWSP